MRSGLHRVMSAPRNRTRPAVGAMNPVTRLNSVVLPAPFGPISPTISPSRTANETPSTARSPPKVRERPATSSTAEPAQQRIEDAVREIRRHEHQDGAVEQQPVFL